MKKSLFSTVLLAGVLFSGLAFAEESSNKSVLTTFTPYYNNQITPEEHPYFEDNVLLLKDLSGLNDEKNKQILEKISKQTGGIVLIKTLVNHDHFSRDTKKELNLLCIDNYLFIQTKDVRNTYGGKGVGESFVQFMEYDEERNVTRPRKCW